MTRKLTATAFIAIVATAISAAPSAQAVPPVFTGVVGEVVDCVNPVLLQGGSIGLNANLYHIDFDAQEVLLFVITGQNDQARSGYWNGIDKKCLPNVDGVQCNLEARVRGQNSTVCPPTVNSGPLNDILTAINWPHGPLPP